MQIHHAEWRIAASRSAARLYARRGVQRTGLNSEAKYMLLGHAFEVLDQASRSAPISSTGLAPRDRAARARLDGISCADLILNGHLRDSVGLPDPRAGMAGTCAATSSRSLMARYRPRKTP
jgi:hypothetical protein